MTSLSDHSELDAHIKACGSKSCGCRFYRRHFEKFCHLFPRPGSSSESWLKCKVKDSQFFVGCQVCASLPARVGVLANFESGSEVTLKLASLSKHEASRSHAVALRAQPADPSLAAIVADAPPIDDFRVVLDSLRNGTAPAAGIEGVGARGKLQKMAFCLAEGQKQLIREQLRQATSMTIARDERHKRLLV
jgi:hypothetical protein